MNKKNVEGGMGGGHLGKTKRRSEARMTEHKKHWREGEGRQMLQSLQTDHV